MPSLRARSLARSQGLSLPKYPSISSFHPRQIILSGLTALWAARLGLSRNISLRLTFRIFLVSTSSQKWRRFAIHKNQKATCNVLWFLDRASDVGISCGPPCIRDQRFTRRDASCFKLERSSWIHSVDNRIYYRSHCG